MKGKYFSIVILSLLIILYSDFSPAQVDYPTKPIQMFIGYAPGGSTDVLVRTLAQEAKRYLGQEVIIVNKPGAGGTVAAITVATAKPDGYTLGATPSSTFTVSPNLLQLSTDIVKETTPILSVAKFNVGVFVKSDSPFKNLKGFFEYAKQNPGKATYGHPGVSTRPHLVMEMMVAQEGVKINFVAFPGDIPTTTALLGGHIMAAGCSAAGWISHVQAGTLRLLAVMEEERMESFPEVPTIVELGYPYPLPLVVFLYGPKGIPDPILKRLEDAFDKASQSASYKKVATENALYAKKNMHREELANFLDSEKTKTGDIIKKLGLGKK
jgi:tripartite-type tricarboxylate transporter receptor subunit TctC